MRLELPVAGYSVFVEGEPWHSVRFDSCTGTARPYVNAPRYSTGMMGTEYLGGEYIVTMHAALQPDGSVNFPRLRLEQP